MKNKTIFVLLTIFMISSTQVVFAQETEQIDTTESLVGNKIIQTIIKTTKIDSVYQESSEDITRTVITKRRRRMLLDSIQGNLDSIRKYVSYRHWKTMKDAGVAHIKHTKTSERDYFPIMKNNYKIVDWVLKDGQLTSHTSIGSDIAWGNIAWWIIFFGGVWIVLYKGMTDDIGEKKHLITNVSRKQVIILWSIMFAIVAFLWVVVFGYPYELALFEIYFFIPGLLGFLLVHRKLSNLIGFLEKAFDSEITLYRRFIGNKVSFSYSKYIMFTVIGRAKNGYKEQKGGGGLIHKETMEIVIHPNQNINVSRTYSPNNKEKNMIKLRKYADGLYGFFNEAEGKITVPVKYYDYAILKDGKIIVQKSLGKDNWVCVSKLGEELYMCDEKGSRKK